MPDFTLAEPFAISPLAHRKALGDDARVAMRERDDIALVSVRGFYQTCAENLTDWLGATWPEAPNTRITMGGIDVLCLSPDEWLILSAERSADLMVQELENRLSGQHAQVVDISDYDTAIELNGPAAVDVLARLSRLDLHGSALPEGGITRTRLAQATVILSRHGANGTASGFRIFVRRSMADYLWCLLAEAGREYGLPPQAARQGEERRY